MNKTSVENLLETLEQIKENNFEKQITVDDNIAKDAVKSLNTMLSLKLKIKLKGVDLYEIRFYRCRLIWQEQLLKVLLTKIV